VTSTFQKKLRGKSGESQDYCSWRLEAGGGGGATTPVKGKLLPKKLPETSKKGWKSFKEKKAGEDRTNKRKII